MTTFTYNTTVIRGSTLSRGIRYASLIGSSTSSISISLGSKTFVAQSGMSVSVGKRVRATLLGPPSPEIFSEFVTEDPTQFVEGLVTAYSGTNLTINVDTIGGSTGTTYASWQLTVAKDLTGGTFNASMALAPESCAGRQRNAVPITINIVSPATSGVFSIYLSPTTTAALTLGTYLYKVLFTPASSSDKFPVISGSITVTD